MALKVYADRMSEPSRAVLLFCKVNGIDFEEVKIHLSEAQHLTPHFKEINPMAQVPAIQDGTFRLFESHAILIHLSSAFPGVADHWYPADLHMRAKIHSVLDWHHTNLRRGAATLVLNTVLAPFLGRKLNPQAATETEKLLSSSLSQIESVWLEGDGKFLLGGSKPSIADLSLVCQIVQLELLDGKDLNRILGPHKKVREWVDNTRNATNPHFDEVHNILYKVKTIIHKQKSKNTAAQTRFTSKI